MYHPDRATKWLQDKRLTTHEKKIMQGHLLIRDNKNTQAVKELQDLSQSDVDFINYHRDLLLGIAHNNLGQFAVAEKFLQSAIEGFREIKNHYHLFTALYNLLNLLSNIGRVPEMKSVLKEMEKNRPEGQLAEIRLLRCQFICAFDASEIENAQIINAQISKYKPKMSENDLISHLVCEFMFQVKIEALTDAQNTLEQMKKHRKFMLTENFNFMKRLLAYLMSDTTIYAYEREFSSAPLLFHQIKVIENLQAKDETSAKTHWSELQKIAPEVHRGEFQYAGEKCLFSLCLEKSKQTSAKVVIARNDIKGTKTKIAYEILMNLEAPIKNSHLFELIWGEAPETKEDLSRLAKLLSKTRDLYQIEIISRKGTYFVDKLALKKAL